jgi:hypothetical protein
MNSSGEDLYMRGNGTLILIIFKKDHMNKDKNQANPKSQGANQDNLGYENTETRTDRDDKEMDRIPSTDTGDEEDPSNSEARKKKGNPSNKK